MKWVLKQKNILDEPTDALICSANVNLTLSGGVGADLLARYGTPMQTYLSEILLKRSPHSAERGEVFAYSGQEMPYIVVVNAVAIDGWYESSPEIVALVTRKALAVCAQYKTRKVALTALATGFGRLTLAQFATGIRPLLRETYGGIDEVVICLLLDFEVAELVRHLPELDRPQFLPGSPPSHPDVTL